MVIGVAPENEGKALAILHEAGEEAYVIGRAEAGEKGVVLC